VKLKLGLPIGSLQKATFEILSAAGFEIYLAERSYFPRIDDEELEPRMVRPQDISRFVEKGVLDAGITGLDWVLENGSHVHTVADLVYSKQRLTPVRWVLAVSQKSGITKPKQLDGKRVATELVNVTKSYFRKKGVKAEVEFSHGATEGKVPDIVDGIVDVTETGETLRANGLAIIDTVLNSTTQLIANKDAWKDEWKRSKIESVRILVEGAIAAHDMVGLKMNVQKAKMDAVLAKLPALRAPTISSLAGEAGFALEIIVKEKVARALIPELKRAGAEGIVEYPLNKLIP
jgi:ATP phosphoribosyltransferase